MNNAQSAVASVDTAFLLIIGISAVILVLIVATMVYFVFHYSRAKHPVAADISGNFWAELIWTVLPTLLVLGMFHYGWVSYRSLRDAPQGSLPVKVTARMWSWLFTYENGRQSDTLVVPVGKPIKLELNSLDVIHGFFVPAFRIKIDTVPGMPTTAWFLAEKPGEHDIFCSVYCGLKHADMLSRVRAVSPEEFEQWLAQNPQAAAAPGKALLEQNGCLGCHSLDGSTLVGPSLKDVFGREVVLVKDGKEQKRTADEAYLRQVMVGANRPLVKGFDPLMPSYAGVFSDEQLNQIIDFLKNGEQAAVPTKPDGAALAAAQGCSGCHSLDGSVLVGPSFKGLFGSTTQLEGGGQAKVDKDYVLRVLSSEQRKRAKDYPPLMPVYPQLDQAQKEALADYLHSLSGGHAH